MNHLTVITNQQKANSLNSSLFTIYFVRSYWIILYADVIQLECPVPPKLAKIKRKKYSFWNKSTKHRVNHT